MTKDQINQCFSKVFKFIDTIPYPQFEYGGSKGSTATTIIYQNNN